MEVTKEGTGKLLDTILPPRLEDAGLEDCALPPDSIKEAFFKAASAVKSRATSFFHEDDERDAPGPCVDDPWPRAKDAKDTVVGVGAFPDAPGPCGPVKGGGVVEEGVDKVVVVGGGNEAAEGDRVVVPGGDAAEEKRGGGCVEGERGKNGGKSEEKKEEESEKPRLVEGFA
ncbi:Mucin-5AC like [Melia azedarach]|uniref:Mucin-5AC like n=1 Tax=Melia azedarach TaxID=155640 RepID=A0ACC1Y4J6_MELAZ|nr:Mucin-5AC like [Melia azedarach]